MDTKDMAAAYDAAASLYPTELAPDSVTRAMLERLSPQLPAGARVIDVGCGAGRSTRWLENHGYTVLSVDVSAQMLQRTRLGRPDAGTAQADMRALPVAPATFDGLTAFFSLVHVPKAEVPRALREFHRVLKPGGIMLASVRRGEGDESGLTKWADGYEMHFTDFVEHELEGLLAEAGFRVTGTETCEALMNGERTTHIFISAVAL